MAVHESWELGGADGLCLGANYLDIDAPDLGNEPQVALSVLGAEGYVYHPEHEHGGEAALVCWDREDEGVSAPLDCSIGEVFLRLLAKTCAPGIRELQQHGREGCVGALRQESPGQA